MCVCVYKHAANDVFVSVCLSYLVFDLHLDFQHGDIVRILT